MTGDRRGTARFVALAALGAGCGRIAIDARDADIDSAVAIDARPCVAPVGHDEDLDTSDDACDVCPHVPDDAQTDTDGDGVGDVCDPDEAAQHFAMFDPFTQARAEWNYQNATFANDTMQFAGVGASIGATLTAPPSPANDVFVIAGAIGAGGTGQRQLSLQMGEIGPKHYYCELFDGGTGVVLSFTYTFDGSTFMQVDSTPIGGRLQTGPVTLSLVHAPPMMRCLATWNGTQYEIGGMIPAGITAQRFAIAVNNIDATISYFVRISTP